MSKERHPHINAVQFVQSIYDALSESLRDKNKTSEVFSDKEFEKILVCFVEKTSDRLDEMYSP